MAEPVHRTGVVAILGRPNAGKSTLLNRLLGEKLAIVTRKPQTTRSRLLGILTRPDAQLLFVDTPGLHDSDRPLNQALREAVAQGVRDCDVALVLVDAARGFGADHRALLESLAQRKVPVLLVATQIDRARAAAAPWPPPESAGVAAVLRICARTGAGIESLLETLIEQLPEGPPLYPDDDLTDRSLRFLAAERVREVAFQELAQELPYCLAVEIESFDESDPAQVRIRANLLLERASQKPIVIGAGGSMIKRIGIGARREIERLLDTRVHLMLRVKVEPHWSKRPNRLKSLGYH